MAAIGSPRAILKEAYWIGPFNAHDYLRALPAAAENPKTKTSPEPADPSA